MSVADLKQKLNESLYDISIRCKDSGWDNDRTGEPVDEDTIKHGHRFINKLEKYGLITSNLKVFPLSDGNLSFEWSYTKPKNAKFNVDFDKSRDKLIWCCYIDGMADAFFGEVLHLESIVNYLRKFNGLSSN